MSISELNEKATTYFDLMAQIEALTSEAEAIKDTLKASMVEKTTEELEGAGWRATWHSVKSNRFDSRKFKADHGDLYAAYTIQTIGTRFTLNKLKA